ncbi:hypothetical protein [Leptolyngbya ohadii]|uniref:hypothetical protein n=1 Tax=Leptolyngbya ohadii TaxID=1962290 RepID=UPI000B5A19BC|nr:hypothetical protein [Leptolyngbya ohadii]
MNPTDAIKTKFAGMPGAVKMLLLAGSGILAIALLGHVLNAAGIVAGSKPQTIGKEQSIADLIQPSPVPTASPAAEQTVNNQELWDAVGVQQKQLSEAIDSTQSRLTNARAQRWLNHASVKCNEEGLSQCTSPYQWLLRAYQAQAATVQQMLLEGKIPTDSETATRFRVEAETLQDIGAALSTPVSGSPQQPYVETIDLTGAIEQLYTKASQFESFRQSQSQQTYSGGTAP